MWIALLLLAQNTRPFQMGFTPWPYEATLEAVDWVYTEIQRQGDLVDQHIMGGIPWQEALEGASYADAVENELAFRLARSNKPIYLAIDSLSNLRDGLAPYWSTSDNQPLPPPWDGRDFDHPEVAQAYISFATDLIERFDPIAFNYGTEASELVLHSPERWAKYVVFAERVYNALKTRFPDLPLMISVALKSPSTAQSLQLQQYLPAIAPYIDWIGVSVYPYAFYDPQHRSPDQLPENWLRQITDLVPGKPVAITETGWIAEDLNIDAFGLHVSSSSVDQDAYLAALLHEATTLQARFLIWFTVRDFDPIWNDTLGQDPLSAIWRDTGLFDHQGVARLALQRWSNWLQLPRQLKRIPITHIATEWSSWLLIDALNGPVAVEIELFDEMGQSLGIWYEDVTYSMQIDVRSYAVTAHSGVITTSGSIAARIIYIHPEQGGTAELRCSPELGSELLFQFADLDEIPLTWKGLAFMNAGPETAQIELVARNIQGELIDTQEITLQTHQRFRGTLDGLFENLMNPLEITRVEAHSNRSSLTGINISGRDGAQLLFTPALIISP